MRQVDTEVPAEAAGGADDVAVDVGVPAIGLEGTDVHVVEYETGGVAQAEARDVLVFADGLEPGEVGVDAVVEEAAFKAHLIVGGHLRTEALVRAGVTIVETTAPQAGRFKGRIDGERGSILTHLGVSAAEFQVGDGIEVLHERKFRRDEGSLNGRIEVMVVFLRQGGRPVVTATDREVSHVVPAQLDLAGDGLDAAGLVTDGVLNRCRVAVVKTEEVHHQEVRTVDGGNHRGVRLLVVTHLDTEGELAPFIVVAGDGVEGLVLEVVVGGAVGTLAPGRAVDVGVVRVHKVLVVLQTDVPAGGHAGVGVTGRRDVEAGADLHTVGFVVVLVLIEVEQRVEEVRIGIEVRGTHRTVVVHILGHVVRERPAGGPVDRAGGVTAGLVVARVRIGHAAFEVQPLGDLGFTRETDVQTFVVGGLDDALRIVVTDGTTDHDLLGTAFNRHVVVVGQTGLENGLLVLVERDSRGIQTTETALVVVVGRTVLTVGVFGLDLRETVGIVERDTTVVGHFALALGTLLGGDDDGAVGSVGTVQSGGGGTLQNGHRLDVLRVDVVTAGGVVHLVRGQQVAAADHRGIVDRVEGRVVHRHTVHDVERLVAARNGGDGTENDLGGSTRRTAGGRDRHTGYTTLESSDEAFTTGFGDFRSLHVLDRGSDGPGHTLHTELRRDDGLVQRQLRLLEDDVDDGAAAHGNLLFLVIQTCEPEGGVTGHGNGVLAVHVGRNAIVGTLDQHAGTDDGLAVGIGDGTLDGHVLGKGGCRNQQNRNRRKHKSLEI